MPTPRGDPGDHDRGERSDRGRIRVQPANGGPGGAHPDHVTGVVPVATHNTGYDVFPAPYVGTATTGVLTYQFSLDPEQRPRRRPVLAWDG